MTNYKLVITNSELVKKVYKFETLEEARALLLSDVIMVAKEIIKDIDTRFTLHIDKIGRKKKHTYHKLPYDIVSGDNYYAFFNEESGVSKFIIGGAIIAKGEEGYEEV